MSVKNTQGTPPFFIPPSTTFGYISFVHTLLLNRVAKHLAANGWPAVKTEHRVGAAAHAVDVYAQSPQGVTTGFEITLSKGNVFSNAVNSLAGPGGVQQLIFLCPLQADCKAVERLLQKGPSVRPYLGRIQVDRIDKHIL